jgi:hypothetical protein
MQCWNGTLIALRDICDIQLNQLNKKLSENRIFQAKEDHYFIHRGLT